MDPLAALGRSALFGGVDEGDLGGLLDAGRRQRFTRGAYLFHEGDPGTRLYVLLSGQVKISRLSRDGSEAVFALLTPGDVFGELALLDNGERTSDAQAVEATECLTIGREALLDFVQARPQLMRRLLELLSRHIRRKDDAFAEVSFLDIPGRVAQKLLELAETHGQRADDGVRITVRLSQRILAGMVGASRENVNRALSRFAAAGAIRVEPAGITILRPEVLRRRA